ncbi:hypothetical protein DI272_29705 [Streptomyces sp. Act143]|uniref:hypothetical protein n=1 Tax=Streptomyces sp. Act143 TaxID=2200760 RepID=UPI000D682CD7|nr:hypothetical protein [Streptomyces sp. Act143]PWI17871.1 hypothetical protein DI272_29705 [Streptomyces sp. Act143]
MSTSRENFADNLSRLSKFGRDIREYERKQGTDDFSDVIRGGLHAEHSGDRPPQGSGYPRRYPK